MYNFIMFAPNKKLGQNFLKDKIYAIKMVEALNVQPNETVIEIGPGLGSLTLELENRFANSDVKFKAVELDIRFVDKLRNMFSQAKNFEIIEANVLDWLYTFDSQGESFRILGSLPYYITSPIIYEILKMKTRPEICVLLVQKEVAEKIMAVSPDSGYISSLVQTFYEIEDLGIVDKSAFSPEPQVDGGIIKLTKRPESDSIDIRKYEGFLHRAYSNPRKMLNKIFYEDERNRAEIDGNLRAQNYNWEDWTKFFKILV